jgi:hypothetical protein
MRIVCNAAVMKCWICGGNATSGEHMTKRSDLKSAFGKPTQVKPLYLHNAKAKNQRVASLDSKLLKSPTQICAKCNNELTQPHDLGWQQMSKTLRTWKPPICPGHFVRAHRIFPYDTARQMLNVHLYFLKLFGCHVVTANIPIDIDAFATAINQGRAHPNVYLKFGVGLSFGNGEFTGMSDMHADIRKDDGKCAFATSLYGVQGLGVQVMFAAQGEKREGLVGAWHPRDRNKLLIADLR